MTHRDCPDRREYGTRNYCKIIYEYTSRELTFESDRLDAIKGVFRGTTGSHDGVLLKTGLPLKSFGLALTWSLNPEMNTKRRTPVSGIPSWSWASAGRPVHYETRLHDHDGEHAAMDLFAYETAGNPNHILGRAISGFQWHLKGVPLNPTAIDSLVKSLVLDPDPAIPIIYLVTVGFHAYLKPAVREMDCGWTYRITNFSHAEEDIECTDHLSGGIIVDEKRFGRVNITRRWCFAVVWVTRRYRSDTLIFWTLALRKAGGYFKRVGIAALSDSRFRKLLRSRGADPRCTYIKLR